MDRFTTSSSSVFAEPVAFEEAAGFFGVDIGSPSGVAPGGATQPEPQEPSDDLLYCPGPLAFALPSGRISKFVRRSELNKRTVSVGAGFTLKIS